MSLIIAVPKEQATHEERVALDPATVKRLRERHQVITHLQSGCGRGAGFYDVDYGDSPIFDSFAECVADASLVVKVRAPTPEEAKLLPAGCTLVTQIPGFQNDAAIRVLLARNITTIAMDLIPRITRAQPMDVLSSQATVAGYKAALLAAELSPRLFPMLSTAAGTVRPSRVIVIGAGVAGLQAIATARRLGAQVEAYDIRTAAREQIESLGARMIDTGVIAEGAGGYARGLTRDEKQQQHDVLAERISHAHAVICAAAIPGRNAPTIVTEDMVEGMLPDTVLVDMAAESGGNCELTRPGETYVHGDTVIVGPSNLPSTGAVHASELFARNLYNMLKLVIIDGQFELTWEDEVIASCVLTYQGGLYHEPTAALMDLEVVARASGERSAATTSTGKTTPDQSAGWIEEDTDVAERAAQDKNTEPAVVDPSTGEKEPVAVADEGNAAAAYTATLANAGKSSDSTSDDAAENDANAQTNDELQLISGIGPGMASRLQEFGIVRFADLAAVDNADADRLAAQLEVDDLEIVTGWIAEARERLS